MCIIKVSDFTNTMHPADFEIKVYENGRLNDDKSVHMRWNLPESEKRKEEAKIRNLYPYKISWIGVSEDNYDGETVLAISVPLN